MSLVALDVNGGLDYVLQTTYDGQLSLALTNSPSGITSLELRDAGQNALDTHASRVDWNVSAGETYYIHLSGTATNIDLAVVNLVDDTTTDVIVHGTDAADTFSFTPTGSYEVSINGVAYDFSEADLDSVHFDGGDGDDVASLYDSTGDDVLTATPTEFRLTGTPVGGDTFIATVTNVAFAHAYAKNDGHDTALVYGSDAPDVLWIGKNELRVDYDAVLQPSERAPFANIAHDVMAAGFETIRAYADRDPNDWVEMHGSSANDVFIGKPHKAEMMNGPLKADGVLRDEEYKITARLFRNVVAVGEADDVAKLYDSTDPDIDVWAADHQG